MARVERLIPYDDLALIGGYAERFGLDPDEVFWKTSFHTVINFAVMWKEVDEYQDRFSYIWRELNREPTAK